MNYLLTTVYTLGFVAVVGALTFISYQLLMANQRLTLYDRRNPEEPPEIGDED